MTSLSVFGSKHTLDLEGNAFVLGLLHVLSAVSGDRLASVAFVHQSKDNEGCLSFGDCS